MKKRFSEEQIIGFLREADAGMAVKDLCRRHGFSEASYYLWRSKFGVGIVSVPFFLHTGAQQKNPHRGIGFCAGKNQKR